MLHGPRSYVFSRWLPLLSSYVFSRELPLLRSYVFSRSIPLLRYMSSSHDATAESLRNYVRENTEQILRLLSQGQASSLQYSGSAICSKVVKFACL